MQKNKKNTHTHKPTGPTCQSPQIRRGGLGKPKNFGGLNMLTQPAFFGRFGRLTWLVEPILPSLGSSLEFSVSVSIVCVCVLIVDIQASVISVLFLNRLLLVDYWDAS